MKTISHWLLPLLMLTTLIGGAAFVAQYVVSYRPGQIRRPSRLQSTAVGGLLHFAASPNGDMDDEEESVVECEEGTRPQRDYWFANPGSQTVSVDRESNGCDVEVIVLTAQEAQDRRAAQASLTAEAAGNWPATLGAAVAFDRWQTRLLETPGRWRSLKNEVVNVPGNAVGMARLHGNGRSDNGRIVAEVSAVDADHHRSIHRLQARVAVVPVLRVEPASVSLVDLRTPGQVITAEVFCWSSTRPSFPLAAREKSGDPCFSCVCQPMTESECARLAEKTKTRVQSGYRVVVTVHERRPHAPPLDIGPLERTLLLSGPTDVKPLTVRLTGWVRGEVGLVPAEDAERIDLGSFPAARGTTRTIALTSAASVSDLTIEARFPEFLEARLEKDAVADGRQRWRLHVTVPPRRAAGRLPGNSEIVLRCKSETPRKVHLPLVGQATQ